MNTDIRISVSFKSHRKRRRLKVLLGPDATDYLLDLWIATAMNHPTGVLDGMDELDIALEAGWEGTPEKFISALMECGFLEQNGEGAYCLHDWEEHQGYVVHAPQRQEKARRAAQARWGNAGPDAEHTAGNAGNETSDATGNATSIQGAMPNGGSGNAPSPAPIPEPKDKTYSPSESAAEAPPVSLSEIPVAMRQVVEYLLLKTGRTALLPSELPAVRALERIHNPARINQEIGVALERFDAKGRDPASLTFEYLYESLKHQSTRRKPSTRAAPQDKRDEKIVDFERAEREEIMRRYGGETA